jgi:hypothetical protein
MQSSGQHRYQKTNLLVQNLRVDQNVIVADLPGYSDRLLEDERKFYPGYVFLELVKAGQN